jgi:hypothetical protein
METLKENFEQASSPVARLLGHSLAVSLGFCGLAVISLIPVLALKLLVLIGMEELAVPLHNLEIMLLLADIGLFAVVFLTGVIVFAVETIATAKRQIRKAWKG